MAIIDMEGFDVSRSEAAMGYNYSSVTFGASAPTWVTGRHGRYAIQAGEDLASWVWDLGGNYTTLFMNFALYINGSETEDLFVFRDSGSEQVTLRIVPSGNDYQLQFRRGGTTLGTSATYSASSWRAHYVKIVVNNSTGEVEIATDGTLSVDLTAQDTQQTGNAYINEILVGIHAASGGTVRLDDIQVYDNSGSKNNTIVNDITVEERLADGDGTDTEWLAQGAGDHYVEVDEDTAPDDASTYIYASVNGIRDLFTFQDLEGSSTTVYGVVLDTICRLDVAGSRTIRSVIKDGADESESADITVDSTSWERKKAVFDAEPNGSSDWSQTLFNDTEFGVKAQA